MLHILRMDVTYFKNYDYQQEQTQVLTIKNGVVLSTIDVFKKLIIHIYNIGNAFR